MKKIFKIYVVFYVVCVFIQLFNTTQVVAKDNTIKTEKELIDYVYQQVVNRIPSTTVVYLGNGDSIMNQKLSVLKEVQKKDDYTSIAIKGMSISAKKSTNTATNESKYEFEFNVKYHTSAKQEKFINDFVDGLLPKIITNDMTDRTKIDTISKWIMDNVEYDYSLKNFDAYLALTNGKVVCQGYAMLFDKMLEKAGIPSEIVLGDIKGIDGGHAWNVVYVDGQWLHIDLTNIDEPINKPYYLRTAKEMREFNFIWDDSTVNYDRHKVVENKVKPAKKNPISIKYDKNTKSIKISGFESENVKIYYNPKVYTNFEELKSNLGTYDNYVKTEKGHYIAYKNNSGWDLYDPDHKYSNKNGIINPKNLSSGKYNILVVADINGETFYKDFSFTVGNSSKKGTTGSKNMSYLNDLLKSKVNLTIKSNKMTLKSENSNVHIKDYKLSDGNVIKFDSLNSSQSINLNLKKGKYEIHITLVTSLKNGYGESLEKKIRKTFNIK